MEESVTKAIAAMAGRLGTSEGNVVRAAMEALELRMELQQAVDGFSVDGPVEVAVEAADGAGPACGAGGW